MTEHTALRLGRLVSPRRPTAPGRGGRWAAALLLRLGCAALLAWIGYIHLHLWLEGYRHIPVNGPLFLLDALAGFGYLTAGMRGTACAETLSTCTRPGALAAIVPENSGSALASSGRGRDRIQPVRMSPAVAVSQGDELESPVGGGRFGRLMGAA